MFSPDIFKAILDSQLAGGPAQACHAVTIITPPPIMTLAGYAATLAVSTLIQESALPGRQIVTTDHIMYGTRTKMPYGVAYEDFNLTFLATNNMLERTFFDEWQRCITDPGNNYFNYYDDYVADIHVIKLRGDFAPTGIPTYMCTIEEAYPIAIQAQPLSQDAEGFMKLNITFAYRRWRNIWDKAFGGGSSGIGTDVPEGFGGITDPFGLGRVTQSVKPD